MRRLILSLLTLVLLAACGASNTPSAGGGTPTTQAPTPTTGVVAPAFAGNLLTALATQLGLGPEVLKIVKVEEVQWESAGLGCPDPLVRYAAAITPGYRITVEANGQTYDIQTDQTGENVVLCQNTVPTQLSLSGSGAPDSKRNPAVEQAIAGLANQLGLDPTTLQIESIEPVDWGNAGLGCPDPVTTYIQEPTPGYKIIFNIEGKSYEVQTNDDGSNVVLCDPNGVGRVQLVSAEDPLVDPPMDGGALADQDRQTTKAIEMLAEQLSIAPEQINIQLVQAQEWPNSGLGCPKPDMTYLQVITPGYLIVLEHNGQTYEFHTDQQSSVVLCDSK